MKPLRVLFAMIEPPDPRGNASARWYYACLKELAARGNSLTVLCTCSRPPEDYDLKEMESWPGFSIELFPVPTKRRPWDKVMHLLRPFRGHFSKNFRRRMAEEIQASPDVIHLEQTWCGWLALSARSRTLLNVHYLRSVDTANGGKLGPLARLNHLLAVRAEKLLIRRYKNIRVLSDRLEREIKGFHGSARTYEVNFGLDVAAYRPLVKSGAAPTLGIMGNMDWQPSYAAAQYLLENVWPLVKARIPEAKLIVFGWSARKKFSSRGDDPDVLILENVPSVVPILEQIDVFVCPNFAATGTKTKIIESMLYGIPVVTTMEGLEGLRAEAGLHAAVGEDAASLAEQAIRLLREPSSREEMAKAARAMIQEHCSPDRTVNQLVSAYEEIRREHLG